MNSLMNLCESWPPHGVFFVSYGRTNNICSRCNLLTDGSTPSVAAVDAPRQSGANKRSLNTRSLRTLKGNKAQGAAVAVFVYYRQRTIQNPKKRPSNKEWRESCWRQNRAPSFVSDAAGFCSHHNNVQSCCKLYEKQKYVIPFTCNGNAWNNTHFVLPTRLHSFHSTSFHWLVWNFKKTWNNDL